MPVIVLTVPQNPIEPDASRGIHGVLSMPFSGFDLMTRIASARKDFEAHEAVGQHAGHDASSRPKGGVGKTTIAFNLAVALGQLEQRTVLIDGSLQFGDLRALLKVPVDAPSILDLPTDRIAESDLGDVLWRDPSGIDILLAPPRIEMAEMLTPRDVDKVLSLLRRVYGCDRHRHVEPPQRHQPRVPRRERHDHRDRHLRLDDDPQHDRDRRHVPVDRLPGVEGPLPRQPRRLAGRHRPDDLERALGRVPEHRVVSDGRLVVQSNNEGVPFVLASPDAPISQDIMRVAGELLNAGRVGRHGRRAVAERRRCPILDRSGSSTPGSAG